jgi:hypothetical protein
VTATSSSSNWIEELWKDAVRGKAFQEALRGQIEIPCTQASSNWMPIAFPINRKDRIAIWAMASSSMEYVGVGSCCGRGSGGRLAVVVAVVATVSGGRGGGVGGGERGPSACLWFGPAPRALAFGTCSLQLDTWCPFLCYFFNKFGCLYTRYLNLL